MKLRPTPKNLFFLIGLLLLSANIMVQAQPCFTVEGITIDDSADCGTALVRGCAPFTINMNTACATGVSSILFDYNYDGSYDPANVSTPPSDLSNSTTHTYTEPGLYGVAMLGNYNGSGDGIGCVSLIEVLPTPTPTFNVQNCANREVQLTIVDNSYQDYEINWGDGISQTVSVGSIPVSHFYAASANYAITVTGIYNPGACGESLVREVTPLSGIPPVVLDEVKVVSAEGIDISFQTDANFLYRTEYKIDEEINYNTTATEAGTGSSITQSLFNLDTENQTYTIRVKAFDICGNEVFSDVIHTLKVEAEAQDGQNLITWEQYSGTNFQQYTLLRNDAPIASLSNLTETSYTDVNTFCKEVYCYRVVAESGTTILTNSISDSSCVVAFTTTIPESLINVQPTIEDNKQVIITWENVDTIAVNTYNIIRTSTNTESSLVQEIDTFLIRDDLPQILDSDIAPEDGKTRYCYTISYTNFCENTSIPTKVVCPVVISLVEKQQDNLLLSWTEYESSPNSLFAYILEKLDEDFQIYEQIPIDGVSQSYIDQNISQDRQVLRYRVRTIVDIGTDVFESFSNVLTFEQPFEVFFPTAFTPDNDGLNDIFVPKGLFIKNINLVIYNREGQVLFTTSVVDEGWDGTHNGVPVAMDTYIYSVESEDFSGNTFTKTGTFTLIR